MDETKTNYYKLLGLTPQADFQMVRKAFVERARGLIEAYGVLMEPRRRLEYDQALGFAGQKSRGMSGVKLSGGEPPKNAVLEPVVDTTEIRHLLDCLVVTLDGRTFDSPVKINRRLMSRLKIEKKIFISFSDREGFEASLVDVSGGGARIITVKKLKVGDSVRVGVSADEPSFALARVVRVGKEHEFGIKWIHVFEKSLPRGFLSDDTV